MSDPFGKKSGARSRAEPKTSTETIDSKRHAIMETDGYHDNILVKHACFGHWSSVGSSYLALATRFVL